MLHRTEDRASGSQSGKWLLLVHQLPPKPSNVRVRTWRRLQDLGAVAVKNSVYALPNSASSQEDFAWIKTEIGTLGGQATVFTADTVDAWSDDDLKQAFRRARQADYEEVVRMAADAVKGLGPRSNAASLRGSRRNRLQRASKMVRERLMHVQAVDFFGAPRRDAASAALADLEARLSPAERNQDAAAAAAGTLDPRAYRGRIWSTRPRPGIDRMASAWLIRKYIDADARFVFGQPSARGRTKVVTFDTYNGDFTHDGPRCTFEVLTARFGLADPVALRLGAIVHDLDLKDGHFGLPEAIAVGHQVEGLRRMYADDGELLQQGIILFEALFQGLRAADASAVMQSASTRARAVRAKGARKRSGKT